MNSKKTQALVLLNLKKCLKKVPLYLTLVSKYYRNFKEPEFDENGKVK